MNIMDVRDKNLIVGIGASAGGVEALVAFFRAAPQDTGMAYVVVTHLATGHVSVLDTILARCTTMPVMYAKDGQSVQPNNIYLRPAGVILTIHDGTLRLEGVAADQHAWNPIDLFFTSLAHDVKSRAVGIVLSGSGSDGTLGIRAIRDAGGVTFAQSPGETGPRHNSMPASAIASGLVDIAIAVEEMPAALQHYSDAPPPQLIQGDAGDYEDIYLIADATLDATKEALCAALLCHTGNDFSGYKSSSFFRRVHRRMYVLHEPEIDAYLKRLNEQPQEAEMLLRDLMIGVTGFFRDTATFDALRTLVIPTLINKDATVLPIRVWIPGCSTGEEVYSIAMLLMEAAAKLQNPPRIQIFATDIDEAALAVARHGIYPAAQMTNVSQERKAAFFTTESASYQVSKQLRGLCTFLAHNLLRDPPFSRLDLISCRNLLIYLDAETQNRVIPLFHYALRQGRFLLLGASESVTRHTQLFDQLSRGIPIFQRRDVNPHGRVPLWVSRQEGLHWTTLTGRHAVAPSHNAIRAAKAAAARVMRKYTPPYVVVSMSGDVVHISEGAGALLKLAPGPPSHRLESLAPVGLRHDLRSALREAAETGRDVVRENILLQDVAGTPMIDLSVEPLLPEAMSADGVADSTAGGQFREPLFLVVFQESPKVAQLSAISKENTSVVAQQTTVEGLHLELINLHEHMDTTIEKYEALIDDLKEANEELGSVNEEHQAVNEELETSQEELQSINEELNSVNGELAANIEALAKANADMDNLFESSAIASVFLDDNLHIRRYTPAMQGIFRLMPSDIGRTLTDIACQLDYPALRSDLETVRRDARDIEHLVSSPDSQRKYLARVLPYHPTGGGVEGVILNFIDVTTISPSEERLRTLVEELNHRIRNLIAVVIVHARRSFGDIAEAHDRLQAFNGRMHALTVSYGLLSDSKWQPVTLHEILKPLLANYMRLESAQVRIGGPAVRIGANRLVSLCLIVHELVTNAEKYGALSVPTGKIDIIWSIAALPVTDTLVLHWEEHGGPPAHEPDTLGMGTRMIRSEVSYRFGGEITFDYAPTGLRVDLILPPNKEKDRHHG